MRCYTVDGTGIDGLRMGEREIGVPGPGEVLVHVRAVSLNYRDLLVAKGRYGGESDAGIVPTSDFAGTVVATGPGVTEFAVGDAVLNHPFRAWSGGPLTPAAARTFVGGAGVDGVLCEQVIYPAAALVRKPKLLDFAEAATLTVAGLTAWAAVITHGRTKPGDWVLVQGTGGVSVFAAQLAHAVGARVVLTTSSDAKQQWARERLGVEETVSYTDPEWAKQVVAVTGGGADVVVEVAGGESLMQSTRATALGGRVAVIGVLGGARSEVKLFDLISRTIELRGIFMESATELRALARAVEVHDLRPVVDRRFEFEEAADAYRHLAAGLHRGKVVIELEG